LFRTFRKERERSEKGGVAAPFVCAPEEKEEVRKLSIPLTLSEEEKKRLGSLKKEGSTSPAGAIY